MPRRLKASVGREEGSNHVIKEHHLILIAHISFQGPAVSTITNCPPVILYYLLFYVAKKSASSSLNIANGILLKYRYTYIPGIIQTKDSQLERNLKVIVLKSHERSIALNTVSKTMNYVVARVTPISPSSRVESRGSSQPVALHLRIKNGPST